MARIVESRESGLRLTEWGEWLAEGTPVTHPGIKRYFHRCIRKDETGHFFLRNQGGGVDECVYFEADDTAYFIEWVRWDGEEKAFRGVLNTGEETDLDLSKLTWGREGVLYGQVLAGERARWTVEALDDLSKHLEETGEELRVRETGQILPAPPEESSTG